MRDKVEGKEILSPDQTGCKGGMGTLDNINVPNYLINRQVEKRKRGDNVCRLQGSI